MVLELTLKHVKALTSLLEQQQQKILALQNGMQIGELQITHTDTHTHLNVAHGTRWFCLPECKLTKINTQ